MIEKYARYVGHPRGSFDKATAVNGRYGIEGQNDSLSIASAVGRTTPDVTVPSIGVGNELAFILVSSQ